MKTLISFSTIFTVSLVSADFNSMVEMFSSVAAEKNYTYNFDEDFAGFRSSQPPELQGTVPGSQGLVFLRNLWNYGCWCRFESQHGTGTGAPVNAMDEVCKVLHQGYDCMMMDDDQCDPFGQTYRSVVHTAESMETMVLDCASKNPSGDECNHRACAIESWFVLEILRLYFKEKYAFDAAFMESSGWDGSECPGSAVGTTIAPIAPSAGNGNGNGQGSNVQRPNVGDKGDLFTYNGVEKQCCGDYPIRFPYNHLRGERECCGGRTYNPFLFTCCDGTISAGTTC